MDYLHRGKAYLFGIADVAIDVVFEQDVPLSDEQHQRKGRNAGQQQDAEGPEEDKKNGQPMPIATEDTWHGRSPHGSMSDAGAGAGPVVAGGSRGASSPFNRKKTVPPKLTAA